MHFVSKLLVFVRLEYRNYGSAKVDSRFYSSIARELHECPPIARADYLAPSQESWQAKFGRNRRGGF